jgi:hypothetical protein
MESAMSNPVITQALADIEAARARQDAAQAATAAAHAARLAAAAESVRAAEAAAAAERAAIVAEAAEIAEIDAAQAAIAAAEATIRAADAPTPPAPAPSPTPAPEPPPAPAPEPAPAPPPPAPAPEPAPPPAPEPAPPASGEYRQFQTWDKSSGPSANYWSEHLKLAWRNAKTGDWIDRLGAQQGPATFGQVTIGAVGVLDIDVTELAQLWLTKANTGALLRQLGGGLSAHATIMGRLSASAPQLIVNDGEHTLQGLIAGWSPSSSAGIDTSAQARLGSNNSAIVQWDLTGVQSVSKAVMRLTVAAVNYKPTIGIFYADPPAFTLAAVSGLPQEPGLAAQYVNDEGIKSDPDVLLCCDDFSKAREVFQSAFLGTELNPATFESDGAGGIDVRGSFMPPPPNMAPTDPLYMRYTASGAFDHNLPKSTKDAARRLDPTQPGWHEVLYARAEVELELDFNSPRDGNKMGCSGWDVRGGYRTDTGNLQHISGNGGVRGDGRAYIGTASGVTAVRAGQYAYKGHAIRMECGRGCTDGNPYANLRPIQWYTYHIDQKEPNGDLMRVGTAVLELGRRHTIESMLQMNSIEGPFDATGNGEARYDGRLLTWVDGVLVGVVTNLRLRRHPDLCIIGPFGEWLFGGKHPSDRPLHYRMGRFVLAKKYIGPRVLRG